MIRVKTRGIKFHRTLHITYNTDLAIPRVRDLLQAIVEVTEILFEDDIFLILIGLHFHPGTCVPNIYRMSKCTVLNVLGYVAFTLLVQNYLCTILPIIYTVAHNCFMYHLLLIPSSFY
jgi:hypothetical protein